jgi:DNA-binding response OmpR family regulator
MGKSEDKGSILIVEDNKDIAEMMYVFFENRNYIMDYASDGITALNLLRENSYDAIVLDLMLPDYDGVNICKLAREEMNLSTPILMLTARDTLQDKVTGLDSGADDYLVKPFELLELEARINALLRRATSEPQNKVFMVEDLEVNIDTLQVTRAGQELTVSPIGYKILMLLITAAPKVVSRREIEIAIWGDVLPDSDTLRSHLYNLRQAVDKPFDKKLIHTIQSRGYRIGDI